MNVTLPTTHLVPVYVAYIDRPGQATEEILVADPEVFAAEAALLVGASISVATSAPQRPVMIVAVSGGA